MKQTLTNEQIKKLYAYCEKVEVYEYDIQIEIVDHIASAIEDQWQQNPEISFGWALKNIRDKFGWKEFRKLESKLSRQLKNKFYRVLWMHFLEYFKLPKILITAAITLFLFTFLQITDENKSVIMAYCTPIAIFSMYYTYSYFPKSIEVKPVKGKSFMILNFLQELSSRTGGFVFAPFWIATFGTTYGLNYTNNSIVEFGISVFLALVSVFMYGYFFYMPKKIREYFMSNYGEFAQ